MSDCLVGAADYRRYWGKTVQETPAPLWSGTERRISGERRSGGHDRRWNGEKGRRYRIMDRRKAGRVR